MSNIQYKLIYKAIPIQLKLTIFRPERKSVTTNSSDNRRNYIALHVLSFWFVDVDLHGHIKFVKIYLMIVYLYQIHVIITRVCQVSGMYLWRS